MHGRGGDKAMLGFPATVGPPQTPSSMALWLQRFLECWPLGMSSG